MLQMADNLPDSLLIGQVWTEWELLAQKENLLVPDNLTTLFLSPAINI